MTYSHYEHHNKIKYLIGVTPKGQILFISKEWGGCASDRHVTEGSVFPNNLLPGDLVLADRGFEVEESVGIMRAGVKTPAFTRAKCKMHSKNVGETRKLAHLRSHVK